MIQQVSDRPQLGKRAVALLNGLREDLSPLQVTMVLAAAQEIHTVDISRSASRRMDQLIHGDHIDDAPDR